MKKLSRVLAFGACVLCAVPAFADPTSPSADGVHYLPSITIYGRPTKPSAVIDVARPTAAHAARDAHEEMRSEWIEQLVPPTLRH